MLRDDRSKTLAIGGGLLLVNTGYLAAFATPSLFYYANVALHVLLGVVLLVIGARWARRQALSMTGVLAALILGVGALLGLALTVTGATRSFRWLLLSHIAVTTTGAVLAVALMLRHAIRQSGWRVSPARTFVALALVGGLGWTAAVVARGRDNGEAYRIENPNRRSLPAWSRKAAVPPVRSSLRRRTPTSRGIIPANFFLTSAACGRCHKDIYEQWNSSAHHFSSFNNQWYRKSIEYMQEVVGHQAVEVVRRLPRSRGVLQRPLRSADQRADQHPRGAGRPGLHVVPFDYERREHDGAGRFRDRVPAAARSRASESPIVRTSTTRLPSSIRSPHRRRSSSRFTRTTAVLLVLSQGAP